MAAIVAYITGRALRIVTIVFVVIMALLFAGVWALAYYVSEWWWLLLLPLLIFVLIFLLLRLIVKRITGLIHRHPFTSRQREQLEQFTEKVKHLAEVRNMNVYTYAFVTIWEVLRNRDETSIERMVSDSKSLKSDFAELEKHFGER